MPPLSPDTTLDYLKRTGRLPFDISARVLPLAWGVSNIVLRIEPDGQPPFIVKQSQPQLRTRVEWLSRCERIYREADVLRALQNVLPPGVTPRVLFEDRPNYVMGLEAVCPGHVVWKESLLKGELNPAVGERLGEHLATIHSRTWQRPEVLPDPGGWSLFDELRIDPFYRHLARRFPETAAIFDDLIAEMSANRICLVHADFSPKNVLVNWPEVALVDFETGHFGDPAFDIGFFLSHLLLKSRRFVPRGLEWRRLVDAFWHTYQSQLKPVPAMSDVHGISQRAVRHLAACAWARIDGKSPVDYLKADSLQDQIRSMMRGWLAAPPPSISEALELYFQSSAP